MDDSERRGAPYERVPRAIPQPNASPRGGVRAPIWVMAAWLTTIAFTAACPASLSAQTIDLTAPTGTLIDPGDGVYWESRGVTVQFSVPTAITALEWKVNLPIGDSFSARIYDDTSEALLASGSPVAGTGTQQWLASPISFTFNAGQLYRIGFYNPGGNGVFPRKESPTLPFTVGSVTVIEHWAASGDSFPYLYNFWTTFVRLQSECGDGGIDVGEQCDDGNIADGDCCDASCQYESNGSPCDDATVCNGNESCDGAGTCLPGAPLDCDDGSGCTADTCDPIGGCINDDAPAVGCLAPGKSVVLIKNSTDDTKDKLLWKWIKGAELDQGDLGDPTATDAYTLCVYAGTVNALVADAGIPPGTGWSAVGSKGYKFKGSSPDGLSLALLKGGTAGKSKAIVKGKGGALPDPTLPLAYPVTVQLKRDGSPLCLESTFTAADEKKNDTGQLKAKK